MVSQERWRGIRIIDCIWNVIFQCLVFISGKIFVAIVPTYTKLAMAWDVSTEVCWTHRGPTNWLPSLQIYTSGRVVNNGGCIVGIKRLTHIIPVSCPTTRPNKLQEGSIWWFLSCLACASLASRNGTTGPKLGRNAHKFYNFGVTTFFPVAKRIIYAFLDHPKRVLDVIDWTSSPMQFPGFCWKKN